ncbi:uncharacterized protein [Dermacentor albipictus]|uniref:uncharacterized protein n=1 Tax=Dermacentor albipictus TaxID=60249 RepID=UPI0038FCB19F
MKINIPETGLDQRAIAPSDVYSAACVCTTTVIGVTWPELLFCDCARVGRAPDHSIKPSTERAPVTVRQQCTTEPHLNFASAFAGFGDRGCGLAVPLPNGPTNHSGARAPSAPLGCLQHHQIALASAHPRQRGRRPCREKKTEEPESSPSRIPSCTIQEDTRSWGQKTTVALHRFIRSRYETQQSADGEEGDSAGKHDSLEHATTSSIISPLAIAVK